MGAIYSSKVKTSKIARQQVYQRCVLCRVDKNAIKFMAIERTENGRLQYVESSEDEPVKVEEK